MTGGEPIARPITPAEADALLAPLANFPHVVLAVSGGADSTALMHLTARWAERRLDAIRPAILVVTIDHGLRAASAAEVLHVARLSREMGLAHRTLRWIGDKPATGIQAAAREARYRLLIDAAVEHAGGGAAAAIVTAHTADDQAETLLMRLARGSGVDGLAAIPLTGHITHGAPDGTSRAAPVLRPLLVVPRARLVATLQAAGIAFLDDPSNSDDRFERVRVRKALALLEPLGLTRAALARTARRMQAAKSALETAADRLEASAVRKRFEVVEEIDHAGVTGEPDEIGVRLLRRLIDRIGGASERPSLSAIEDAHARLFRSRAALVPAFTLGGTIVERRATTAGDRVLIYREPDRGDGLPTLTLAPGQSALWDARIRVSLAAHGEAAVEVGPLGDDWTCLARTHPSLAAIALPAAAMRGLPAFRRDGRIVAVPMLVRFAEHAGDGATAAALSDPADAYAASIAPASTTAAS